MTKEALFDFLLFHAYSKFTGFLVNILGLAVAFMGIILYVTDRTGTANLVFYLAAAFLFLGYTPIQLKRRAAKQIKINPEYAKPVDYEFPRMESRWFRKKEVYLIHGKRLRRRS